jgi:phenylalanyl-tRNA synthetase beta chain
MNISWKWLLEYVKYAGPRDEAVRLLTMAGLNVDSVDERPGGDALLVVEVTSNRPDCLGHLGVARELAALTDSEFVLPPVSFAEGSRPAADLAVVEVADAAGCPRYTARVITGVKVRPSPPWLAARLEAVGLRPINNVVDVTNFVLYEHGQPLHAFDYAKLAEHRIVVRRARAGEQFLAIDHSQHELKTRDLVIADARRAVALAGVMGGADSEVTAATADVLLESAMFDPLSVRTTSRATQLMSDSSYRFERGVDYEGVDWASRRACRLIQELGGGEVARGLVDIATPRPETPQVTLRFAQIPRILGIDVPRATVLRILRALGATVVSENAESATLVPPAFRRDLIREVDLIEEVARVHGYDKVPYLDSIPTITPQANRRERVTEIAQTVLAAAGYQEAISITLTDAESAALFSEGDVSPPLGTRQTALTAPSHIRKSVLAGLVQAKRTNQDAGRTEVSFFEIARAFRDAGPDTMPYESVRLALLADDEPEAGKGVVELLAARLGLAASLSFQPGSRVGELDGDWQADILLAGTVIGFCGLLDRRLAEKFKFRKPPFVAEIELDPLIAAAVLTPRFQTLPQFPPIQRDLALVVDEAVLWRDLESCIRGCGLAELEELSFLSLYRGEPIPEGKKSLALRLVFRKPSGTLTHEEADAFQSLILAAAKEKVDAELRAGS